MTEEEAGKFDTPKLDEFITYLQAQFDAGKVTKDQLRVIVDSVKGIADEVGTHMSVICGKFHAHQRWFGFSLGIIATLVVNAVALAIYFDYFK